LQEILVTSKEILEDTAGEITASFEGKPKGQGSISIITLLISVFGPMVLNCLNNKTAEEIAQYAGSLEDHPFYSGIVLHKCRQVVGWGKKARDLHDKIQEFAAANPDKVMACCSAVQAQQGMFE
jgi:hypothetical protein